MSTLNEKHLAALATQALTGTEAPAGLPDVQWLTQLANDLYAALPNQSSNLIDNPLLETEKGFVATIPVQNKQVQAAVAQQEAGSLWSTASDPAPHLYDVPLPCAEQLAHILAPQGETQKEKAVLAPFYFLENQTQSQPVTSGLRVPTTSQWHDPFHATKEGSQGNLLDIEAIRRDFPILKEHVNGQPLIWFDNAATTQKPQIVLDRLNYFYQHENSNIHRAAHELAARATEAYEQAREITRHFINARSVNEIVFVRGTTEAINLVAQSWGREHIKAGDEILITWLEHHANIVPWKRLCDEVGAHLRVAPVDETGQIILEAYEKLITPKTKLVSLTQVSNALGTVTPAAEMARLARAKGAKVLIDGAQSVCHLRTDVQALDCDWFVFSGHKVFAPTGIGVLYGREALLNQMQPWQGGGNMIQDVTFDKIFYHPAPNRFEAGTGNIADAVGLGAALEYVQKIGIENIARHEHALLVYANRLLDEIPGLRQIGTAKNKASVISFVLDGYRTEEIGSFLNQAGIAVRSGHHCAQPILRRFGLETTVRPSFSVYNTFAEIDVLVSTLKKLVSKRQWHS